MAKKAGNEFEVAKTAVLEKVFAARKMQNERDEKVQKFGNDYDSIALSSRIRDEINDIDTLLKKMNEILNKQAKNPKVE